MKNLSIKIAIALLTFLAGSITTWVFSRVAHLLSVKERSYVSSISQEAKSDAKLKTTVGQSSFLDLEFLRFILDEGKLFAEFRFTNTNSEIVYYTAYSKGDTPIYRIMVKRDVWSVPVSWTFCGTGLQGFPLSENESVTFRVPVSDGSRALKVGIKLVEKKGRNSIEVWSKEIDVSMLSGALSNNSFNPSPR